MIAIARLNIQGFNVSQAKKNDPMKTSISHEIRHCHVDANKYITTINLRKKTLKVNDQRAIRISKVLQFDAVTSDF